MNTRVRAISEKSSFAGFWRVVFVVMGLMMLSCGCLGSLLFGALPALEVRDAKSWTEERCTVLSSEMKVNVSRGSEGRDNTTYKPVITYRYVVDGQPYVGDRYDFFMGSSGQRAKVEEIVARHPVGAAVPCFVDRARPNRSVINRDYPSVVFVGLAMLVFVVVGGGLVAVGALRGRKKSASSAVPTAQPAESVRSSHTPQSRVLTAARSHTNTVILLGVLAFGWNSVAGYVLSDGWREAGVAFTGFFVLVGAGLLGSAIYSVLGLFNPRVKVTLTPGDVRLGETVQFAWELEGDVTRLRTFELFLEASEEATYSRGTDSYTDRNIFLVVPVAKLDGRSSRVTRRGEAQVTLPQETMHSFSGERNKIVWRLKAVGDIPRWPDLSETFELQVLP